MSVTSSFHRGRRIAVVIVVLVTSTGGATVAARAGSSPSDIAPGLAAQAALAALSLPSTPQPLPDSLAVSSTAFRDAAGCEALRTAYQQPDAPMPAGATVTVATDGGLRVEAPFGQSAIFVRDDPDGACTYEIRSTPTMTASGPDVPALDAFVTVTCLQPLGVSLIAVAQIDVAGAPVTVAFGQEQPVTEVPTPQPFTIGWYPGLAADVLVGSPNPPGAVRFEGLTGTYDPATASAVVSGPGPTGPISASFQCTVGNLSIPGL